MPSITKIHQLFRNSERHMTWYIDMTITWNKTTDDLCLYLTMTQNKKWWIQNLINSHRCNNVVFKALTLVSLGRPHTNCVKTWDKRDKNWRQHHDSGRYGAVFIISFVSTVLLSLRHVADIVSWLLHVLTHAGVQPTLEFYCESDISSLTNNLKIRIKVSDLKGKGCALTVLLLVSTSGSILRWKIKIEWRFKNFKTIQFFYSFLSFSELNLLYSVSTFFFNFFS
jgi:hypothetical protein